MKRFPKTIAFIALAWAVVAPLVVMLSNVRDQQARRLSSMAGTRMNALSEDKTNETVVVPLSSIDALRTLAKKEPIRTSRFTSITVASSAVIAVLAFLLLIRPGKPN
jgi:hypothetical protein